MLATGQLDMQHAVIHICENHNNFSVGYFPTGYNNIATLNY